MIAASFRVSPMVSFAPGPHRREHQCSEGNLTFEPLEYAGALRDGHDCATNRTWQHVELPIVCQSKGKTANLSSCRCGAHGPPIVPLMPPRLLLTRREASPIHGGAFDCVVWASAVSLGDRQAFEIGDQTRPGRPPSQRFLRLLA